MKRATLAAAFLLVAVAAADAQTRAQPRKPTPPAAERRIGFRGYAILGGTTLAADETFEAVAGTRSRSTFGGGVQVTSVWKEVFADVGASQLSLDGERVFVESGRVFKLGIPLEIEIRPLDIAGGWRFRFLRGRLLPFAGAGMTYLQYDETSRFAGSGENVSEGKAGPLVLAGVEYRVWRWISAGGDFRWRRVNAILGRGGVSSEFREDDAGGVNAALRISIGQ